MSASGVAPASARACCDEWPWADLLRLARNIRTDMGDEPERAIERTENQKGRNHIAIAQERLHHDIDQ